MPVDTTDKVVLTHVAALRRKYGSGGVARIRSALRDLRTRDAARGILTSVVDASSRSGLRPFGQAPVPDPADWARFLEVSDAVCTATAPGYVLLLGGPDVVPLVPLVNPMPASDPDGDVPSDLPYACSRQGADTAITAYVGPSRVVGRLPDVPGAEGVGAAAELARLIRAAGRWEPFPRDHYADPLCVSTARWEGSTQATMAGVFGPGVAVRLAPPGAPPWPGEALARPLHFINLHGATADPTWLADPGFGVAMEARQIPVQRNRGCVSVTECCYGAELWDPSLAGGTLAFPLAYLAAGAYGLFGSTCVSYGGRSRPDAADVLCRIVLVELMAGASLGRAVLAARQAYVAAQPVMAPVDLKTLAQFSLIADPSIHPVDLGGHGLPAGLGRPGRAERRTRLAAAGAALAASTPVAEGTGSPTPLPEASRLLGVVSSPVSGLTSFDVTAPTTAAERAEPAREMPARVHVGIRRRPGPAGGAEQLRMVEVREDASGALEVRELESRSNG